MITIVPFEPEHLKLIDFQPSQIGMLDRVDDNYGRYLKDGGICYTGMRGDQVVICAGVQLMWDNRGVGWVKMSKDAGRDLVFIHRTVQGIIDNAGLRRIEAYVDSAFEEGKRWVEMLGMSYEGTMKAFGPDGRDHDLYARIYD